MGKKLSRKEKAVQESLGIKPEITVCSECLHFGGRLGKYAGKCFVYTNTRNKIDYITGAQQYWIDEKGWSRKRSALYLNADKKNTYGGCGDFTYNTRNLWQRTWFWLKNNWIGFLITWGALLAVMYLVKILFK